MARRLHTAPRIPARGNSNLTNVSHIRAQAEARKARKRREAAKNTGCVFAWLFGALLSAAISLAGLALAVYVIVKVAKAAGL